MTGEKIFIAMAALALVAIVIYRNGAFPLPSGAHMAAPPIDETDEHLPSTVPSRTPKFMSYNLPWRFAPPVGNVLPSQSAPIANAVVIGTG